jgi:hypothetical protein
MSSRPAAAWGKVWPPRHRRHRQGRSLARTDPAGRGKPAWVHKNVRLATTVSDLQGDVFIKRSALERFPTIIFLRRPHCTFPIQSSGRSEPVYSSAKESIPDFGLATPRRRLGGQVQWASAPIDPRRLSPRTTRLCSSVSRRLGRSQADGAWPRSANPYPWLSPNGQCAVPDRLAVGATSRGVGRPSIALSFCGLRISTSPLSLPAAFSFVLAVLGGAA